MCGVRRGEQVSAAQFAKKIYNNPPSMFAQRRKSKSYRIVHNIYKSRQITDIYVYMYVYGCMV